jgi:arginine decarboxylase
MSTIRVVAGNASGPTTVAAYDAALADAGVHNYNLSHVSSVIPADGTVERVDTAPDLGPVGHRLTVVEARAVSEPATAAGGTCAGLGWTVAESGRGLFYEASGTDPAAVRESVALGLASGRDLREWSFVDEQIVTECIEADTENSPDDAYATAVVLGIYGESEPIA